MLNNPQEAWKDFLADIGAQVSRNFDIGLVYAKSESSFWQALRGLKSVEKSNMHPTPQPQFHEL